MTDAAVPNPGGAAGGVLKLSAWLWFVAAVAGQWLFVYYIASFYGPSTLSGRFEAWDLNTQLTDGFIAGDVAGNLFFAAHVLLAAVLTFGGTLQLAPQIRDRFIAFHRWNGRLFLLVAIACAVGGLYLEWVRGAAFRAPTGLASAWGLTLNGLLIFALAPLAWRAARRKDIEAHQQWATRLFLVVNGSWFLRVGFLAWMLLTGGSLGAQPFFSVWAFGCYLLPLAVYELYLRAKVSTAPMRLATATCIGLLTAIMIVGEIGVFLFIWRPLIP